MLAVFASLLALVLFVFFIRERRRRIKAEKLVHDQVELIATLEELNKRFEDFERRLIQHANAAKDRKYLEGMSFHIGD